MICPIKAKKDIVVYKVFEQFTPNVLLTPFRKTIMRLGEVYEDPKKSNIIRKLGTLRLTIFAVRSGFFHSYVAHPSLQILYDMADKSRKNYVVVRCIIPKGTLYYKSHDGIEICAKKIIIETIVSRFNF